MTKTYHVHWLDKGKAYEFMYDRYQPANQMCIELAKLKHEDVRMVIKFKVEE